MRIIDVDRFHPTPRPAHDDIVRLTLPLVSIVDGSPISERLYPIISISFDGGTADPWDAIHNIMTCQTASDFKIDIPGYVIGEAARAHVNLDADGVVPWTVSIDFIDVDAWNDYLSAAK